MEDNRVVKIIDVTHLFYKYAFGMGGTNLTVTLMINGVPTVVDTKLPSMAIKNIHRIANYGFNPTVVCFDSKGCSRSRKAYFGSKAGFDESATGQGYKAFQGYKSSRDSQNDVFYQGINLTKELLSKGGVMTLSADGYEADDLVKVAVDKAKQQYPNLPIHIITGDADLVPLVDDQVSVFLSSRKTTYAERKEWELTHYVQITPRTYQKFLEDTTAFKNLKVPYNTVILEKCLRGDKSDEIEGYPKFTPTKYNKLIDSLIADGIDIGNLFRYGSNIATYCYRDTEQPIPLDLIKTTPHEKMMIKYTEPKECTNMCNVLSKYLDDDIIAHIRFVYNGINLNSAFTKVPDTFKRRPLALQTDIHGYLFSQLQSVVSVYQINLPVMK